jgi:hypothetical protein
MKTLFKSYTTLLLCCVFAFAVVPLLLVGGSSDAHAAPDGAAVVTAAASIAAPDAAVAEPVDVFGVVGDWLQVLSLIVAACAAVAAMTPTPRDDGIFLLLRRVVDFLALNFGHAKNVKPSEVDRRLS